MSNSRSNIKPRTVNLLCAAVSKTVEFVAWEEQKLDLGSIARVFGLEPSTLKLNGHFISRGVDFVSSSVTWRSLLSFFSHKGLSAGDDDKNPLVVDGKLCKVGTKRAHDPQDVVNMFHQRTEPKDTDFRRREQAMDISLLASKKLKESNSSRGHEEARLVPRWNGFKRKQLLEDVNLLKKLNINETNSDNGGRGNESPAHSISSGQFKCSYMSSNMKRLREDDEIFTAPSKRIR